MTTAITYRCDRCGNEDGSMFLQAGFKVVCPGCIAHWATRHEELVHGFSGTIAHVEQEQHTFGIEHLTSAPPPLIHVPPEIGNSLFDHLIVGSRWATWSRSAVVEHSAFPTHHTTELRLIEIQAHPISALSRGWPPSWFAQPADDADQQAPRHWGSTPVPPWFDAIAQHLLAKRSASALPDQPRSETGRSRNRHSA